MPFISLDKLFDKELIAAKKLNAVNAAGKIIKIINPGASAGIVFSYLNSPVAKLNQPPYLMFYEDLKNYKNPYYIRLEKGSFKITDEIQKIINQETSQEEKQKIAEKGPIVYYIEKYGIWILGTIILLAIIKKEIMKNKNILPILLLGAVGYYFYMKSKKPKGTVTLGPLEKSSAEEFEKGEVVPEQKPKTLLAKAASLVKKAANTPEGKSLIAKGKKALTKKLKLKQMGATYL